MNAIIKSNPATAGLRPQSFADLVQFANLAAKSSMVPPAYKGQPESIVLAVQMGDELGLAPMQSLQNISVINGRPAVWGDAVLGLCRQSAVCKDIVETVAGEADRMVATCTAIRVGAEPIVRSFSVEDAKKAGLWGKSGPWQQYPRRMLQMRARGFAVRDAFPDVLRGLITAEEAADIPARDTFAGPTIEHATSSPVRGTSREQTDSDAAPPAAKAETPKRQTITEWLDALALELASCDSAELEEILARDAVQQAQDKFRNGAKDRLNHIIHEALRRTARADDAAEGELDPDNLFADPAADPFREVAPA
jgi:hypothetical protein